MADHIQNFNFLVELERKVGLQIIHECTVHLKFYDTRMTDTHTSACEMPNFVDLQWDDKILDTACSRLNSRNITTLQIWYYLLEFIFYSLFPDVYLCLFPFSGFIFLKFFQSRFNFN